MTLLNTLEETFLTKLTVMPIIKRISVKEYVGRET